MNTISFHQAAKLLRVYRKDKPGKLFGRNTLINQLREAEVLMLHENIPYQKYMQQKLFIVQKKEVMRTHGPMTIFVTKFTEKGFQRLKDYFINNNFNFYNYEVN